MNLYSILLFKKKGGEKENDTVEKIFGCGIIEIYENLSSMEKTEKG